MTRYESARVRIRVLRNLMQVQNYYSSKWEVKDYMGNLGFITRVRCFHSVCLKLHQFGILFNSSVGKKDDQDAWIVPCLVLCCCSRPLRG